MPEVQPTQIRTSNHLTWNKETMKDNTFTDSGTPLVSRIAVAGSLKQEISRAVDAIGGFGRLVEPGEPILLKPNFNTADPPPAANDPEFVRATIELLYEHGAGKVIVGESSTFSQSSRGTLRDVGLFDVAEETGAEVLVFEEDEWVRVRTGGDVLKRVSVARAVREIEKIVYVCNLKTHKFADFTISLKLAMGMVRPWDRLWMHAWKLREKLADLNLVVQPDLILVDARTCFISGGPSTGELRAPNLILASGDRIAVDVEGLKVIQSYPGHGLDGDLWELPLLRRAIELGVGVAREADYRVVGG
jgi:uncharacterized protein (DUF362 family)